MDDFKNLIFSSGVQDGKKLSWTVADAVDYKGFPADKSKTGGWIPAALILGILIVYYSLLLRNSNLILQPKLSIIEND